MLATPSISRSAVVAAGLCTAIVAGYMVGIPRDGAASAIPDVLFITLSGIAALACAAAARARGVFGRAWRWFAAGCASWSLASVVWAGYRLAGFDPVPFPSVADIFYLALSPCFFVGLGLLVRAGATARPAMTLLLDALLVAVSLGGLFVMSLLLPVASDAGDDPLGLLTGIGWQTGTIGIVFLLVVCLACMPWMASRRQMTMLLLGVTAITLGNIVYARLALTSDYREGSLVDLAWHLGFVLVTLAALEARASAASAPLTVPRETRFGRLSRAAATTFGGLTLAGLAAYAGLRSEPSLELAITVAAVGVALAGRAGYAAVQGELLARRTDERDRLAAVVAASTVIAGSTPADELLDRLVETATLAVGRARGELYVYSRDGSAVEAAAFFGFSPDELAVIRRLGEFEFGVFPGEARAIATQAPTVEHIDDPAIEPELSERLRAMGKMHTLVSPLLAHGEVVGLFAAWSPFDMRPFEGADLDAVSIVSKQAGLAIYNARLLADARRQAEEQRALLAVSQASVSSTDMREVLKRIARASLGIAGAEACGVDLWRPETGEIEVVSEETIDDWPGVAEPETRYSVYDLPVIRRVFEQREPLILNADDPHAAPEIRQWFFTEDTRSVLIYPLVIGQECLGALNMYSRKPHAFSAEHLRLAREIAEKASLGVQSARLFASTRRFADEQAALLQVSQAVVSGQELTATLEVVARAAVGVAGAEGCEIELYNPATNMLEHVCHAFVPEWDVESFGAAGATYPAAEWPSSQRALRECSLVSFVTSDDLDGSDERRWLEGRGIRSVLIVPMHIGDAAVGLLSLYSRRPYRFESQTERFALELAAQAALAVDRARLYTALQLRADTDGLTGVLNHRAILETVDQAIISARQHGTSFSVLLIDIDNFKLFNDTHGHLIGDEVLRATTEILRRSVRERDRVGRYGGDEFLIALDGAGAREAECVAARLLDATEACSVTVGDLQLPLKLSVGIAVFPEHGASRQELIAFADSGLYAAKESGGGQARITGADVEPREPTTFGTLMGLVRAVDRKDRYTKVHSDIVTEVAVRFGQELGLDADEIEALAIAGQLHDVGKIAVPDSVLRKPGRLTPEESAILRQHVVFSELMVQGVPHMASVTAAIAHHHERWDGRGYPHGVAGRDIPLLGRIMALADAWSAMTHDRPYRKRLAHDDAIAEIRAGAGTQFDPSLVELFIVVVERMEAERRLQRSGNREAEVDLVAAD